MIIKNNKIRKDSMILLLLVMPVLLCVHTPFIALVSTLGGVVNKDSGANSSIGGGSGGGIITTLDGSHASGEVGASGITTLDGSHASGEVGGSGITTLDNQSYRNYK